MACRYRIPSKDCTPTYVGTYTVTLILDGMPMSVGPESVHCIDSSHPSLRGHFPGMPMVPGVVLFSQVMMELSARNPMLQVTGIRKLKFLRVLQPGQRFTINFESVTAGSLDVKCRQEEGALLMEARLVVTQSSC